MPNKIKLEMEVYTKNYEVMVRKNIQMEVDNIIHDHEL